MRTGTAKNFHRNKIEQIYKVRSSVKVKKGQAYNSLVSWMQYVQSVGKMMMLVQESCLCKLHQTKVLRENKDPAKVCRQAQKAAKVSIDLP